MPITEQQIFEMIQHWLNTPENGYYGSSYGGRDITLATPEGNLNDEISKGFMTKIREDVPILVERPLTNIVKSTSTITFSFEDNYKVYRL